MLIESTPIFSFSAVEFHAQMWRWLQENTKSGLQNSCFCVKGFLQWLLLCWHQVDFPIWKPSIEERTLLTKAANRLFHVQSRCNSRSRGRHRECRFDEPPNDITLKIVRAVLKGWAYTDTVCKCSEAACVLAGMFRSVKMWFWNDFTHRKRTMNLFLLFVMPVVSLWCQRYWPLDVGWLTARLLWL